MGEQLARDGVTSTLYLFDTDGEPALDASTLVVSLGGDGTFLRATRLAHRVGARVVAVNLGQVGFLLNVPSNEIVENIKWALVSDAVSERLALEITISNSDAIEFALNEVVVERASPGHMVKVKTFVDKEEFLTYSADGVMVSTPTGSTGYNFSAGGPVVDAALALMILTPVAPHFTIGRSIVVPVDKVIRLLIDDKPAVLVADGQRSGHSSPASTSRCARARPPSTWRRRAVSISRRGCAAASERVMPKANLVELYAHKLGVIDDARLEFGSGFNVITGETGAGKTLLLGALGLSLGADASASRYALTADTRAVALFEREGDELAFSREVSDSGRLRSSLNGAPSSVEALRNLAEGLIVIHGQHDSLTLRSRSEVLRLIDDSGTVDSGSLDLVRRELRDLSSQ